jgi:hypothetical protein
MVVGVPRIATTLSRGDTIAIGARGGREPERRCAMSYEEETGSDKVTASTRAFEEIDAQVFPGPGRGATPSEAVATDCWGGPSPGTVQAYHRMIDLVMKHQRAHSERRASLMNTSKR